MAKQRVRTTTYSILKELEANTKCPPQAKLILDIIAKAGGSISRDDLLAGLKRAPEEGGLKTVQAPERILGFYTPKLTEMGVMSVVKEMEDVPEEPKKEKTVPASEGEQAQATESKVKGKKGKATDVAAA